MTTKNERVSRAALHMLIGLCPCCGVVSRPDRMLKFSRATPTTASVALGVRCPSCRFELTNEELKQCVFPTTEDRERDWAALADFLEGIR